MGLKTTNYEVKAMKTVLPEAYAYIRETRVSGDYGTAIFAVHKNRELAQDKTVRPYEEIRVTFKVDRTKNDRETAYNTAKSQMPVKEWGEHGEEEEVLRKMPFYGWEDDIKYENTYGGY